MGAAVFATASGLKTRCRPFAKRWISGDYPRVPQRQAKAAAMGGIMAWLANVAQRCSDIALGDLQELLVAAAQVREVMDNSALWLTPEAEERLAAHGERFLLLLGPMHTQVQDAGVTLWKITPKAHEASHVLNETSGFNPSASWCYRDEDQVGPAAPRRRRRRHCCVTGYLLGSDGRH
jgi:hypothetical protein